MAKAKTFVSADNSRRAVCKFDSEWEEFTVEFWDGGKKLKKATYHTDCPEDAEGVARHWVSQAE